MRTIRDEQGPFVIINTALIAALTPNEFIVYAQSQKRAGNDGECWESLEHMAQEVGMGKTTLRLALKGIARKNLVRKERQPGKTDLYSLTAPSEWRLEKLVDPDGSRLPNPLGFRAGVARNPTTEPARIPSTNKIPLELDPLTREEGDCAEISSANDRSLGNPWPVSSTSPALVSDEQPNSQQPEDKAKALDKEGLDTNIPLSKDPDPEKEKIDGADARQGNVYSSEQIKIQDRGAPPPRKTSQPVIQFSFPQQNILLTRGQQQGWWKSYQELVALQWAIHDVRKADGYAKPALAVRKMLEGLLKGDLCAIEEIGSYWARFDAGTQLIAPAPKEATPWIGEDGEVDLGYRRWIHANRTWLDGKLPDGQYKTALMVAPKSNKFAQEAWAQYQESLRKDAARERFQRELREEKPPTEDWEPTEQEKAWAAKARKLMAERAANEKAS